MEYPQLIELRSFWYLHFMHRECSQIAEVIGEIYVVIVDDDERSAHAYFTIQLEFQLENDSRCSYVKFRIRLQLI